MRLYWLLKILLKMLTSCEESADPSIESKQQIKLRLAVTDMALTAKGCNCTLRLGQKIRNNKRNIVGKFSVKAFDKKFENEFEQSKTKQIVRFAQN